MSKEIYDKKDIYDELNKQVYFRDGGSVNLASLASSVEKVRSNSKGGNSETSSDATKRFETEYVRGEDDIATDGSYVSLGDFTPDIQYQDLKAGDIVDVLPKEEDITNVIFRNNGTQSIHTMVGYESQDSDNFVPGTSYYCIRYERIADFPSDPNTQMSMLVFYKYWSSTGRPSTPYFVFSATPEETESGVTGLIPSVIFKGDDNSKPVILDPDSDYVGFIENDWSSFFRCIEVVVNPGVETSTPTLTPKRQDDGVVSILDYYKFYYVAEGKTYVMSRDGIIARPLDITKSVVESLREKVRELEDKVPTNILMTNYGKATSGVGGGEYIASDISASEVASMLGIREIDNIDTISERALNKLLWGNVTNLFISTSEGIEQASFEANFKAKINLSRDLSGVINQIIVRIGDKDQIDGGYGALRLIYNGSSYSVMMEDISLL